MEQQQPFKFNDLTREVLEDFIAKMSKEDKQKLKEYIESHPRNSSSGVFACVKSYIYNNYFRTKPNQNEKKGTFVDVLETLLEMNEDD